MILIGIDRHWALIGGVLKIDLADKTTHQRRLTSADLERAITHLWILRNMESMGIQINVLRPRSVQFAQPASGTILFEPWTCSYYVQQVPRTCLAISQLPVDPHSHDELNVWNQDSNLRGYCYGSRGFKES